MQWQDGQLSPDTRYRYRIIAKDADELESDPSESETILTPASPP